MKLKNLLYKGIKRVHMLTELANQFFLFFIFSRAENSVN